MFDAHLTQFEVITTKFCNFLKRDLPHLDEAVFFQAFGKKLENNLSTEGKTIYGSGLNQSVLTTILKKFNERLQQEYKVILSDATTEIKKNFDPAETENALQTKLTLKLNQIKQEFHTKLLSELANQNQVFNNPADKKELNAAFSYYWETISKKYSNYLSKINLIWSKLAALKLHIRNEEKKLKLQTKNSNTTFSVNAIDFDKLSIGVTPDPTPGWRIDKTNLTERLMHKLANQKVGENFHIVLTLPDRNGISRQIGEIGFQCRSPTVALFAFLIFYLVAVIHNDDIERMVTAFEKIITQEGIAIDTRKISYTLKQFDNQGKSTIIKEKVSLNTEEITRLDKANQTLKENLKKEFDVKKINSSEVSCQPDAGYASDSEEEQAQSENFSTRPRL